MKVFSLNLSLIILWTLSSCNHSNKFLKIDGAEAIAEKIVLKATDAVDAKMQNPVSGVLSKGDWLQYDLRVNHTGRYKVEVFARNEEGAKVWIEDYINNPDQRTYDITGKIQLMPNSSLGSKDGSPLAVGKHPIKIHVAQGDLRLDSIRFTLMYEHQDSPNVMTQNMEGSEWEIVWSDEFDYSGLPDSNKWSYNVGDWGWGNNELQYYTHKKLENARVEEGYLVIEAHKISGQEAWTSARLTTQGKAAFTYGKIEFKAKVPTMRGTWAAGWTLGESYRDELSWPYCGEIDILECVGYEIDDATGNGRNHASCHTRAFYFKQNNQITASTPVNNMNADWHTYSVEWYPDSVIALVDDIHYYTYDKTANELEWPFNNPQAIILNLAIGGGWGGAQGLDPELGSQQFLVDYVRVYQRKK